MKKKDVLNFLIGLAFLIVILGIIIGIIYITYYFVAIRPKEERLAHKIAWRKKILSEITNIKKEVKYNAKQGKQNFALFKKYRSNLYLYHHNKIAMLYLKKSAYDGYAKAEYDYVKYSAWPGSPKMKIYSRNKNYILYSQTSLYAKDIGFMQLASKQNYKSAMFQIALLYLYGAYPVVHYSLRDGYYDDITLSFKNKKKAKKMLYKLAYMKYKPAMKMVNRLYNY
jgi:hypothetical protein